MATIIQLRNDTSTRWTSANPTLAAGEVGIETNTGKMKLGDGVTAWNSLAYFGGAVTSVNGQTGVIVLDADDVGAEKQATVQPLSATDSITLADNYIYNGGEQTSLTITLPSTDIIGFICDVDFSSGATATTLLYSLSDIFWEGVDVAYDSTAQKNIFTPVANKRYTIVFYFDGVNYNGRVGGV